MRLDALSKTLNATLSNPAAASLEVSRVMTLEDAEGDALSFFTNPKYLDKLPTTKAVAVLVDARTYNAHREKFPCPALLMENAYLGFAQSVAILHPPVTHTAGVSPLAFVHPDAVLGPGVTVMPLAYVGRATVGANTVIYPHVFLDDGVTVGPDSVVYPHVVMMRGTTVGARAILQPGCVLGSDGFGFAPGANGTPEKIPQVGTVAVGEDVEIGANTTIDRAALGVTRLGNHVKLDNQVQIAHNVVLGENVIISGQSAVGGSAKLGKNAMMGGCSAVVSHASMGDGAKLAAAAHTMHNIPAGETWSGTPAIPRGKWARMVVHEHNLDEYVKAMRDLEKKVGELEARLAGG